MDKLDPTHQALVGALIKDRDPRQTDLDVALAVMRELSHTQNMWSDPAETARKLASTITTHLEAKKALILRSIMDDQRRMTERLAAQYRSEPGVTGRTVPDHFAVAKAMRQLRADAAARGEPDPFGTPKDAEITARALPLVAGERPWLFAGTLEAALPPAAREAARAARSGGPKRTGPTPRQRAAAAISKAEELDGDLRGLRSRAATGDELDNAADVLCVGIARELAGLGIDQYSTVFVSTDERGRRVAPRSREVRRSRALAETIAALPTHPDRLDHLSSIFEAIEREQAALGRLPAAPRTRNGTPTQTNSRGGK